MGESSRVPENIICACPAVDACRLQANTLVEREQSSPGCVVQLSYHMVSVSGVHGGTGHIPTLPRLFCGEDAEDARGPQLEACTLLLVGSEGQDHRRRVPPWRRPGPGTAAPPPNTPQISSLQKGIICTQIELSCSLRNRGSTPLARAITWRS